MTAPSLPGLLVSDWRLAAVPFAGAAIAAAGYLVAVRRIRGGWPVARTAAFLCGLAAALSAVDSGLERFDDRLLSAHMAQHMLLLLIAPLLLLIGRPLELVLRALPAARRPPLARALRRLARVSGPLPCLIAFSVAVVVTHLPVVYGAAVAHPLLHDVEHAVYLVAGGLMWWPILDGVPQPRRRLSGLGRLIYLIAAMVPMALVGAYLNRHPTLVYAAYGPPARAMGISAVADQQNAGAIMWVLGDVIMVAVGLWAVMGALLAEERRQQARDRRARLAPERVAP